MKQPTSIAVIAALLCIALCSSTSAQSAGEVLVLEIYQFDSQKNLSIYNLFGDDDEIEVINSCDALGWVVLRAQNEALSKSMVRAYVDLKIIEILEANDYVIVDDKEPMDVLEDCRAEMLRQSEVE